MSQLLTNLKAPNINGIDAQRILANQVLENIYQGTIEDEGKGVTQRFTEDCSGAQIRFVHVKPVFAKARELGATINGGNFPSYVNEGQTESFGLDVLTVLDDPIDLAQVSMDMIPVDLLTQYTKSYTDQVNVNINAMTLAGKYLASLVAEAGGKSINKTSFDSANDDLATIILTANSLLDDGVEEQGVSMFPQDDRIVLLQASYRPILLKKGILNIGGANYAYDIAEKGTVSAGATPRKNADGFVGYLDNVPVHIASSLIFKVAGEYLGLTKGDMTNLIGYVSSGLANVRGIATPHGVKVIDNPLGQGIRIQPLTRMGFKVVEGYEKGNSLIYKYGTLNPISELATIFSITDLSLFKLRAPASRVDLSAATLTSSATTKVTATCANASYIAVVASSTPITSVSEFVAAYKAAAANAKGVLTSGTEATKAGIASTTAYAVFVGADGTCLLKSCTVA